MKTSHCLFLGILLTASCSRDGGFGANPSTLLGIQDQTQAASPTRSDVYYAGTAQILNLISGATSTEDVIFERIVDPDAKMLIELACVKSPGKPAALSPVYMKVDGSNLKIADTQDVDHPGAVQGTGTVAGEPWRWNYLKFSMTAYGARVEDANFLVGNMLIARKQIFLDNGTPLELYDINASLIDATTYQDKYSAMGCPAVEN